jgi:hypothetical protein
MGIRRLRLREEGQTAGGGEFLPPDPAKERTLHASPAAFGQDDVDWTGVTSWPLLGASLHLSPLLQGLCQSPKSLHLIAKSQ